MIVRFYDYLREYIGWFFNIKKIFILLILKIQLIFLMFHCSFFSFQLWNRWWYYSQSERRIETAWWGSRGGVSRIFQIHSSRWHSYRTELYRRWKWIPTTGSSLASSPTNSTSNPTCSGLPCYITCHRISQRKKVVGKRTKRRRKRRLNEGRSIIESVHFPSFCACSFCACVYSMNIKQWR